MSYKTNTKKFIRDFNFPDPDWGNLLPNFPNLPKKGLSKEEGHLLDAIKLAWLVSDSGRKFFYRSTAKTAAITFVLFISLISLISLINQASEDSFTRTVNAATVNIDSVIQSTMSAILK